MVLRSSATRADSDSGRRGRPGSSRRGHAKLSQEPGGLVGLALGTRHRCHHQPRPGSGARDVEEPTLLRDPSRGGNGCQDLVASQPIGLQQGSATAYVRPPALLDARDHDQVPLQPLGAMGRQDADRRPA